MEFKDIFKNRSSDNNNHSSIDERRSVNGSNDLKISLETVLGISDFIKTSLGPKSGDKLIVDQDGNLIVTNDGYSIIKYLSKSSKIDNDNDDGDDEINGEYSGSGPTITNKSNESTSSIFSKSSSIERKRFQCIVELLIDCCKTQERLYGDGTTSVLVLIGSFCKSALMLIYEKGIPPHIVTNSFQISLKLALDLLNKYYLNVNLNEQDGKQDEPFTISLEKVTQSSLLSKSISFYKNKLTKMSIDAVKMVKFYSDNMENTGSGSNGKKKKMKKKKLIDLKRIKILTIQGGSIEDSRLINGCLIKRFFSHENMDKVITDVKVILLSCSLEFPKLKTKFTISTSTTVTDEFDDGNGDQSTKQKDNFKLVEVKNKYYQSIKDIVKVLVDKHGLKCIICQWGIDQEINEYLNQSGINAINWVAGDDLERISISSGANIINDLQQIGGNMEYSQFIGEIKEIKECVLGNDSSIRWIEFSDCKYTSTITLLVRGGSKEMCDETSQCLRDSIHIVAGCLVDPKILPSGGSTEFYLYNKFENLNSTSSSSGQQYSTITKMSIKSWSESLLSIPITLLENGGYDCQNILIKLISIHSNSSSGNENSYYGININNNGQELDLYNYNEKGTEGQNYESIIQNMKFKSWELLNLKKSILKLATETVCMILSLDTFICL